LLGAATPAKPASPSDEEEEVEELGPTDEALEVSRATVRELVSLMGLEAQVTSRWGEAEHPDEARPLLVDIRGDDLSLLIGRRGESLAALQYITRLIVGKELGDYAPIVIDVEGYRARRERQLRQLARRMADEAVERARTMTLEPMPPADRRSIHLELRDHPRVYTESVGEGEQRKVTVIPRGVEDPGKL
jgi:spoIIIJ-associated protein